MKKLLLLFLLFFAITSFTKEKHPFHVGSIEFSYNNSSKTFEVTGKFFIDDLENALNKNSNKTLRFQDAKFKKNINDALKIYATNNLKLKANGKLLKLNYIGFEEENESVNIYLESEKVASPKKMETVVSMLYNEFDDQMNIIHFVINKVRKSEKLTYPDQYSMKTF